MDKPVIEVNLRLQHWQELPVWAKSHFRHNHNDVLQVAGSKAFDSLLFAGGHVMGFSGRMFERNGEFNAGARVDVQLLLSYGDIQHVPKHAIFLVHGGRF
jgi:hypothetical protein